MNCTLWFMIKLEYILVYKPYFMVHGRNRKWFLNEFIRRLCNRLVRHSWLRATFRSPLIAQWCISKCKLCNQQTQITICGPWVRGYMGAEYHQFTFSGATAIDLWSRRPESVFPLMSIFQLFDAVWTWLSSVGGPHGPHDGCHSTRATCVSRPLTHILDWCLAPLVFFLPESRIDRPVRVRRYGGKFVAGVCTQYRIVLLGLERRSMDHGRLIRKTQSERFTNDSRVDRGVKLKGEIFLWKDAIVWNINLTLDAKFALEMSSSLFY